MGFCESMRVWRWQGSGGALRTIIGAMLLTLGLSQSVLQQTSCTSGDALQNLTQPKYENLTWQDTGFGIMTKPVTLLVESFLQSVQPNPFPKDLFLKVTHDLSFINPELIKEVLLYDVGFVVCAVIGILYIILMPIIGIFLACCRCCGNCGGKMQQKQTPSTHWRRRFLYSCTFFVTVIILAGNIFMFKSNEDLNAGVTQSPAQLNTTMSNIRTFISSVPQQVQSVVNESFTTIDTIASNLNNIGPQLGADIQGRLLENLGPLLQLLRLLNQETRNFSVQIQELNSSLNQLKSSMDRLQGNITAVKNAITNTLSDPTCVGCNLIRPHIQSELDRITVDTTITTPNTTKLQLEVNKVDLASVITQAENYFNSIPQNVTTRTNELVQRTILELENTKTQLSNITSAMSMSAVTDMMKPLNQLYTDTVLKHSTAIKNAEDIRFKVCIALCCVVVLVVVCNFLGLVLGPLGLTPKTDPTMRSCMSDSGGTFFMMSAGFSFLFSWLLMIVVVVLFLLGGHIHTLVCRSWVNGQLLQFIDDSGLVPNISQMLGIKAHIGIIHIYRDCAANQPLWKTLHIHEKMNPDEIFNTSKYVQNLQQQFETVDFTMSTITILSPEVRDKLTGLNVKTEEMNTTALTWQINTMSSINLNATADELEASASATDPDTQAKLQNHANDLRKIQATIETSSIPQMKNLNSTVTRLRTSVEKLNRTLGEVLRNVGPAQDFLNTNAAQIARTESKAFLDCQLGYMNRYTAWAKLMITEQMGLCKPVADSVDFLEIMLCSYMVKSLNVFWCSLGWCLFFFIPSIICSIKLAKYYRKMKFSDVYDEDILSPKVTISPNEYQPSHQDALYLERL